MAERKKPTFKSRTRKKGIKSDHGKKEFGKRPTELSSPPKAKIREALQRRKGELEHPKSSNMKDNTRKKRKTDVQET
jgi:hypothetical protein